MNTARSGGNAGPLSYHKHFNVEVAPMNAHDFSFTAIDGGEIKLGDYAGKAVLVVNTASACGYTPQYAGLQALWRKYREQGLVVLGVPSNDFGGQEPGSEAEVQTFCETNYGVDFPLTAKVAVKGEQAHPFYKAIARDIGAAASPQWNFHKILIGPDGEVAEVFESKVTPDSTDLTEAIERSVGGL
ncbi:MAG: glutathione peroxidase [Alphaproteobacteria bacterium]